MPDVFSYPTNSRTEGQVASADFAFISIGEGKNSLVQNVDVTYQQQIDEVMQVGDTQIYWLPGRPQGRINIQQLVGTDGFFRGWQRPCGLINTASVSIQGGRCDFQGSGSLEFSGSVIESLNVQLNTSRQTIVEGANIRVSSMQVR